MSGITSEVGVSGITSEVGVSGITSEVGVSGTNIRGRCEWDEDQR